ncbi:carboxylesterase/lipase family protein [Glaciimonas sp. PCH181]|uniref:carboxylesterase/lipase family protein n=1 Tax=Glaciimonas sp. PCH181 TaxID=2133943 RepID=UPI000D3AFF80|nr:carboxylesterase family protein [Glaciimonas sp. PCH181]PUA19338.1 carboxylesterase [Glaciimonas sp. PCH181]
MKTNKGISTIFALLAVTLSACGGGSGQKDALATSNVTVQTTEGPVVGVLKGNVVSYLGMPYAKAPVGTLRWMPPQAPVPRTSTLSTASYGNACPQTTVQNDIPASNMSEDCLFINVQEPAATVASSKLPVVVYIHGGAFTLGSGAQVDGSAIATTGNIVFASFNYRLGALGYLANAALQTANGDGTLGNFAVMDQQAALQWVQKNIAAFGGDPNNVTVWGLSAGATSTFTLLESPLSKGLFSKAVMQSGGGGAYSNLTPDNAIAQGNTLIQAAGCTGTPDALACLRGKSATDLVAAQTNSKWRPTIDGKVVTQVPSAAFITGNFNRVPVMIGGVYDEGTLFVPPTLPASVYTQAIASLAPPGYDTTKIQAAYPLANYAVPAQGLARAEGDALYACGNSSRRDELSAWVPVFGWEFTDPTLSFPTNPTAFYLGTSHGTDASYWFGAPNVATSNPLPAMQALGVQMKKYLVNFARNGDPNGDGSDRSIPHWPRYVASSDREMVELTIPSITVSNTAFETTHNCNTLWGKAVFPPIY